MTPAQAPCPPAGRLPSSSPHLDTHAVRVGEWTFTPSSALRVPKTNATLRHKNLHIELRYSSSIFEAFMAAMGQIQAEFVRLSRGAEPSAAHGGERAGKGIHA